MKMRIALFNILLLLICYPQKSICQQKSSIDAFVEKQMHELNIVGMGAAIILDKKLVWAQGYGYADKENNIPFTTSTVMNIASVSKTFTGVCLMKAAEEGKLSLDEDINTYLPFKVINPNFPEEKITLRHLATHTSGLVDRYPFYSDSTYFYDGKRPEPLDEFLRNYFSPGGKHFSEDNFLKSKPGSRRSYSNIGAGLAGYIVELRTGKKLGEYARQHIFRPLKMRNSGWSLAEVNKDNHTRLYKKEGDSIVPIPLYEGTTYPDGGVRTSVNELANFFVCLLNDGALGKTRILKKETVDAMLSFQFTESNKPENVDINKLNSGIFWSTKLGGTRIGHNGSDPGVRTFMLADLSKQIGIILFFNTSLREDEEDKYVDFYTEFYNYAGNLRSSGDGHP